MLRLNIFCSIQLMYTSRMSLYLLFFMSFQRNKAANEQAIPLLMPQHHMVIPHYLGKSTEIESGSEDNYSNGKEIKRNDSFSSSYQDVPLLMPQEANGLDGVKIEPKVNGFNPPHDDLHGQASKHSKSPFCFRKSKVEPLISDMPMRGFVDDFDTLDFQGDFSSHVRKSGSEVSETEWWEAQERGDQVVSSDEIGQVGPRVSCRCQVSFNLIDSLKIVKTISYHLQTRLAFPECQTLFFMKRILCSASSVCANTLKESWHLPYFISVILRL